MSIQKYKEKRDGQWYQVTITINDGKKEIPLLARLFGKKKITEETNGVYKMELYTITYKKFIYTYKEIVTERKKIDNPSSQKLKKEEDVDEKE